MVFNLHMSLTLALLVLLVPSSALWSCPPKSDEVSVTVVTILASKEEKDAKIDKELEALAKEIRKKDPSLKGFRLGTTSCKSVAINGKETFPLIEDQEVSVIVQRGVGKDERVCLKVKPPHVGDITYTICCGKFFPIITRYNTKEKNERLIIAVMVKPCE